MEFGKQEHGNYIEPKYVKKWVVGQYSECRKQVTFFQSVDTRKVQKFRKSKKGNRILVFQIFVHGTDALTFCKILFFSNVSWAHKKFDCMSFILLSFFSSYLQAKYEIAYLRVAHTHSTHTQSWVFFVAILWWRKLMLYPPFMFKYGNKGLQHADIFHICA